MLNAHMRVCTDAMSWAHSGKKQRIEQSELEEHQNIVPVIACSWESAAHVRDAASCGHTLRLTYAHAIELAPSWACRDAAALAMLVCAQGTRAQQVTAEQLSQCRPRRANR